MNLGKYQELAMKTCMLESKNFSYMFLNMIGEMGEFASKVAKAIRKDQVYINGNHLVHPPHVDFDEAELRKEAGDILWQLSGLCTVMGWSLEDVARENLKKLADRQKRNVIDGNGDNR